MPLLALQEKFMYTSPYLPLCFRVQTDLICLRTFFFFLSFSFPFPFLALPLATGDLLPGLSDFRGLVLCPILATGYKTSGWECMHSSDPEF